MPWGALVSPPVAESEGQGWTAGISLGSMYLGAEVGGQGGHVGPLPTSPLASGRPRLKDLSISPTPGLSCHP